MFEAGFDPVDPASLDAEALLVALSAAQRAINRLTGWQLACAAEFGYRRPAPEVPEAPSGERAARDGISEFADAEIGAALTLSSRAAARLLGTALDLRRLPATAAALAAGELDLSRARLICEETAHLDDAQAGVVETRVIDRAPGQVYSELRRALRRAAHTHAPAAEQQRAADVAEARRTWVDHDGDGRSRFAAEGPTHDILRIAAAVDAVARTLDPQGTTLEQRRFDAVSAMADTILDDPNLPGTRYGPPGVVLLAPTGTLARLRGEQFDHPSDPTDPEPGNGGGPTGGGYGGWSDRPVELAGDGPIPDALAVELLEAAHTTVVPFDPTFRWQCEHTFGREVPARLARHLAGLHPRCVFPGCAMPTHRCDLDHVVPWPDGPTCACNLAPLCRYHHRLKTHTGWRLTLHPHPRRIEWTSPTGRAYHVHPDIDIGHHTAAA